MSLANPVAQATASAVYENGLLKLLQPLPLRNYQRVRITILPEEPKRRPAPERVRQLHEKANAWLARQSLHAVREPQPLAPADQERLDAEFDQLLTEIRQKAAGHCEEELAARVDEAVAAIRGPDA